MFKPPGDCPNCGFEVAKGARACPECGADASTGWKEEANVQGLGLPDEEFDYDEFVAEEFGQGRKRRKLHPLWWITAVLLLLGFLFLLIR